MIPFAAPQEDILFSLEQVAGASNLAGYDGELHAQIAEHFAAFAASVLAPLNHSGDREGARLVDGRVVMPQGFRAAYEQYCAQGWPGLGAPESFGGQGLGALAMAIVTEIFAGANHGFEMTLGLVPGAVRTLLDFGSPAQQSACIPPLASGAWLSTMALTEPGAGSDLSRIKCRAQRRADGLWTLSGEKIFISGGDQDLSEEILHLVLARSGPEPLAGLSLFLCRSVRANGARNGVKVMRIEEKLGIHASPTCQIYFDEADAELLGQEGQGLKAMFTMMNHARLSVALQGAAHCARAGAIARAYAESRIQGKGLAIAQHPDVARMLDEIDLRTMGARAVTHLALVKLEGGADGALVELLTPIAKFFGSEMASEAADLGIQVLGGYGFVEEYEMAQILRDARICRIYEGANGIHALALATRLLRLEAPLRALDDLAGGVGELADAHAAWREAWAQMRAAQDARPLADAFMRLSAELVHQIAWVRISERAGEHSDPARLLRLAGRARARFQCVLSRYNAEKGISPDF